MEFWSLVFQTSFVVFSSMALLWLLSVILKNVSIVDIFWGSSFSVAALSYMYQSSPLGPSQLFFLGAIFMWATRLSLYLAFRNYGKPEDRRYVKIRKNTGPSFWWKSFFTIFLFQGFLSLVIGLPIAHFFYSGLPETSLIFYIGLTVIIAGTIYETVADWQLSQFLANDKNKNKVMDKGLWSLSRHPNYFGDFVVWWGIYICAISTGSGYWTAIGPLIMSFALYKFTGAGLLEEDIEERRPGYKEYVNQTPLFFPKWPS
ncbi:MAG: DUF1295 domain-containing protein [Bdellovibrionales bacterium]